MRTYSVLALLFLTLAVTPQKMVGSSMRDLPSPITSITLSSGTFVELEGSIGPGGQGVGIGAAFAGGSANLSANHIFLNAPFGPEAYSMGYKSAFGQPVFTMTSTIYNPSTGIFSGTFTGEEFVRLPGHTQAFAVYLVSGSFSESLNLDSLGVCGVNSGFYGSGDLCGTTGVGQINMNSERFLGTVTPEPGTLVTMGTGLLAIAGLVRRKLSR
jgi:hypothetical protein